MRHIKVAIEIFGVFMLTLILVWPVTVFANPGGEETAPGVTLARQATKGKRIWNTTDHSKHPALQKNFKNGNEVTAACLSCHSEASAQFHKTIHWTWLAEGLTNKDGQSRQYGKGGESVNNFCISTNKMQDKSCLACHTGWNGKQDEVNCLKCHGQREINWTEAFEDINAFLKAGDEESLEMAADIQQDVKKAVQSVGLPGRKNCGACHFNGGGGDGVKHGDLDSSLTMPDKNLDVHMSAQGQNFRCVRCHTTSLHNISGRIYTAPAAMDRKSLLDDDQISKITCESCHSATPHIKGSKPNDHTDKVACQSCHIPMFARQNPTKVFWDWSKAGKTKDGKQFKVEGPYGKETYLSKKGEMKWEKNIKPDYYWFNGSIDALTIRDKIDPSKPVKVSHPMGKLGEKNARIFPFKVMHTIQPYDKVNHTLLAPLLSTPDGYWTKLDWQLAFKKGMTDMGLPYSGAYDFVKTTYVFPITHMVAPRKDAVKCIECHVGSKSRLASLTGFYMPGRDHIKILDMLGWLAIVGAFIGVFLHGVFRIISNGNRKD